jgi:hypothetical protein
VTYTPIETAIALALYAYNVSAVTRGAKLYNHFAGDCMDPEELVQICHERAHAIATELPFPSAVVYVAHALEKYGEEAREKVRLEKNYGSRLPYLDELKVVSE